MIFEAVQVATGRRVAIKEMSLKAAQKDSLTSEMVIMKKAKHPCVVEFMDAFLLEGTRVRRTFVPPLTYILTGMGNHGAHGRWLLDGHPR